MFTKTFSALTLVAGLTFSSLGFAATPSTTPAAPSTPTSVKVTKIHHHKKPAMAKVTPEAKATKAVQPRTPAVKSSKLKVTRTSKLNRVRTASKVQASTNK
jgi:hypothetical protein